MRQKMSGGGCPQIQADTRRYPSWWSPGLLKGVLSRNANQVKCSSVAWRLHRWAERPLRQAAGRCQVGAVRKSQGWPRVGKRTGRPGRLTGITPDLCRGETNLNTVRGFNTVNLLLGPGWPPPSCAEHRTWAKPTPGPHYIHPARTADDSKKVLL